MAKYRMLQSLCSTSTWNAPGLTPNISKLCFSCVPELYAEPICKHSCALESLDQHKTSHRSGASGSMPNINISSIMCFGVHAQHNQHIYTYITNNWITPNIQRKSSCSYGVGSLTQYKIKINIIIMINMLMPINGRSKIWDITLELQTIVYIQIQ